MFRRMAVLLAVTALLGACGGDGGGEEASGSESPRTTAAADDLPDWLTGFGQELPDDLRQDGDLYVSDSAEMVYAESCDDARAATQAGGVYGPTDGAGYAFMCAD